MGDPGQKPPHAPECVANSTGETSIQSVVGMLDMHDIAQGIYLSIYLVSQLFNVLDSFNGGFVFDFLIKIITTMQYGVDVVVFFPKTKS